MTASVSLPCKPLTSYLYSGASALYFIVASCVVIVNSALLITISALTTSLFIWFPSATTYAYTTVLPTFVLVIGLVLHPLSPGTFVVSE